MATPPSDTYKTVDLDGQISDVPWDQVMESMGRVAAFFKEVGLQFTEREDLLWKVLYAVCLREHVLIIGPTGSAKSMLTNTIFGNIEGATVWGMDFTKYTVETHLFGAYDQQEMAKTGAMTHMTEGTLVEANFGKGGEFFDANDPTLRTLLGVLNEREVRRGSQIMKFPLICFVGDTNFAPENLVGRQEQIDAVQDRLLFRFDVDYVESQENRLSMLTKWLNHQIGTALPKLYLEDVVLVSGVIHASNLLTDPYVLEAYQEATFEYNKARKKQGRPQISDRRYLKAAQIMEVSAMLHRRRVCTFDDLWHTAYALVQHKDDKGIFDEAMKASIEKWVERAQRRDIERELHSLRELTGRIPQEADLSKLDSPRLKAFVSNLQDALDELHKFEPEAVEVRTAVTVAIGKIHGRLADADTRMLEILVENLPAVEGPATTIQQRFQHAKQIYHDIRSITPRSQEAIAKYQQALHKANAVMSDLETAFTGRGTL